MHQHIIFEGTDARFPLFVNVIEHTVHTGGFTGTRLAGKDNQAGILQGCVQHRLRDAALAMIGNHGGQEEKIDGQPAGHTRNIDITFHLARQVINTGKFGRLHT